jgi:hypothetical protein
MRCGPSLVRHANRRRIGERLGGRKKIIRGLGGFCIDDIACLVVYQRMGVCDDGAHFAN